jgi:hypothetical protein
MLTVRVGTIANFLIKREEQKQNKMKFENEIKKQIHGNKK